MTTEEGQEWNTMYFKEYIGSLVCLLASQLTEASEVEQLFNAIDKRYDTRNNPEVLEIREELRGSITKQIDQYRDRFEAERAR